MAVTDSASLELTALLGALNPSTRTLVDCGVCAPKSPHSHRKRTLEIPRWRAATAAERSIDASTAVFNNRSQGAQLQTLGAPSPIARRSTAAGSIAPLPRWHHATKWSGRTSTGEAS